MRQGTIEMRKEFDIISKVSDADIENTHRSLQGYTAVPDASNTHLFTMLQATSNSEKNNEENSAYLVEVAHKSQSRKSSIKKEIAHANDCAYYKDASGEYYLVATATKGKNVYVYKKSNLKKFCEISWTATKNVDRISSISHYKENYFFLSKGKHVILAALMLDRKVFETIRTYELSPGSGAGHLDFSSLTPQGMWSVGNLLFKVFGEHDSNNYLHTNYIGKWEMDAQGNATLEGVYKMEKSVKDYQLFEIESISATSNSMYAAVKRAEKMQDKYQATLYSITLK